MTYPPGGPGYPPAQQPTTQFGAPTQQISKAPEPSLSEGAGKLPVYLLAAVAVLGLAVYLFHFGPLFTLSAPEFPGLGTATGSSLGVGLAVIAAILAGLLAAASLLPKQRSWTAVVAVISTVGFLLVLAELINKPSAVSIGWALYLIIACTVIQAGVAIGALLLESGVISAPAPRPKYDQQQYGQYGAPGQYYGSPQGPPQGQPQHQQRPGYPSQYGGYPSGPSTGGFPAMGPQNGPPTPPTGFPAYGQPPSPQSQSGSSGQQGQSAAQPQHSSSHQSGQNPS